VVAQKEEGAAFAPAAGMPSVASKYDFGGSVLASKTVNTSATVAAAPLESRNEIQTVNMTTVLKSSPPET